MTRTQALAWRRGLEDAERFTISQRVPQDEALAQASELYDLARKLGHIPPSRDPIRTEEEKRVRQRWIRLRAPVVQVGRR